MKCRTKALALLFTLVMVISFQVVATPLEYDPAKQVEREIFLKLYTRTVRCMHDGSLAMLRQGSRDAGDIQAFTAQTCAGPLVQFLIGTSGMSQQDTTTFILTMTERGLDSALHH